MRTWIAQTHARTDFGIDACSRDRSAAPPLYAQSQPERGALATILDLAQPTATGRREAEFDCALLKREPSLRSVIRKSHDQCSDGPNISSRVQIRLAITDGSEGISHHPNMASPERGDWYLQEWFETMGMIQRDLVTKLDYPPATANALWHGVQRYRRDHIQDVSALLNIKPFELLMSPEEAMSLRRLRSAIAEVAKTEPTAEGTERAQKTGTAG